MEKTYELLLGPSQDGLPGPHYQCCQQIRHGQYSHWPIATGCIAEQVFDGRYAYLYYYEYWLEHPTTIPIKANKGDLHLIYAMATTGINSFSIATSRTYQLSAHQGAYLYLPAGSYSLQFATGHHILVGFIIDTGIFRPPADRRFAFLAPLVQAKKTTTVQDIPPVRFHIAPPVIGYIRLLFERLNPYTLDNEYILLQHLVFLINLTRFRLVQEDGSDDKQDWAFRTHKLLRRLVAQQGAQARFQDLAQILGLPLPHLRRLYKARYGISLRQYRNQLLLDVIEEVLPLNDKLLQSADQVGFSGVNEMNRFIRNQTGLTAFTLKNRLMNK